MMLDRFVPGLIFCAAFAISPAAAEEIASTYTKHDFEACKQLPSPEPDVIDLRECEGYGGFKVRWSGAPDATWIEFSQNDLAQDLKLGSFFVVGTTVEWRGPVVNGKIEPRAAIVRYHTGASVGSQPDSSLVVYRLTGTPCAVAAVPGASSNANAVARAAADKAGTTACY
jgi:hypothetical protein